MTRNRSIVAMALVVTGSIGIAIVAASQVRSPQQRLADVAPPNETTLTEPVTTTVVSETASFTGVVKPRSIYPVINPGGIVTRLPLTLGAPVDVGVVVAEVAARPIFAVTLAYPLYREITPGATGDDVGAVQQLLAQLGYEISDASGTYGRSTERALRGFYQDRGYEAPTTSSPTDDDVDAAVAEADAAAEQVGNAPDPASAAAAQTSLSNAKEKYYELRAKQGTVVSPRELAALPALPGSVVQVSGALGSGSEGSLLDIGIGGLVVVIDLPSERVQTIATGQAVEVQLGSEIVTGKVDVVDPPSMPGNSTAQSGEASASANRTATIASDDPSALPESALDLPVPVRVVVATSDGPVLAVPLSAIFEDVGGKSYVEVPTSKGRDRVAITTGVIGDGLVEISTSDGSIKEGSEVIVGSRGTTSSPTAPDGRG